MTLHIANRGRTGTLCGAPVTVPDISMGVARRMTVAEAREWQVCEACIRHLQSSEAERLERAR